MKNEDIIEDVITGEPTLWLNPLVIVPKDEYNIRMCVEQDLFYCENKIPGSYGRQFACVKTERLKHFYKTRHDVSVSSDRIQSRLDLLQLFHQILA